jgi:hypothetical protein
MSKYNIFPGIFVCHTCKAESKTLRLYIETKEMTWMCPEKHLNSVSLQTKKNKRDYEREERK